MTDDEFDAKALQVWNDALLALESYDEDASATAVISTALRDAVKAAQQWQPIETAPKDGDSVLICGGTYHYDQETYPSEQPFTRVTIADWRGDEMGWSAEGYGREFDGEYFHRPTHWMPLPAPIAQVVQPKLNT